MPASPSPAGRTTRCPSPILRRTHFTQKAAAAGPALYRGTFSIGKPTDTFLDMRAYGKGQVWVNGHALGRYWRIGPQGGLYLPGAWLHPGRNEVVLLDLDGGPCRRSAASIMR